MATKKYKCNNGHEFTGDDYTQECPVCGSTDIERVGSSGVGLDKIFQYFKENKIISYIIIGVIIIFLIFKLKDCSSKPEEEATYSVEAGQVDDYIEVNIKKHTKEQNGKTFSQSLSPFSKYKAYFNFKDRDGNSIQFVEDNKIYLCKTTDYVIKFTPTNNYLLRNKKETDQVVIQFDLGNKKPNPKGNCAEARVLLEIIKVGPNNSCGIVITTNYDKKKKVMISINGKNGNYKAQNVWNAKEIKKYDVWAYIEGEDTSQFKPVQYHLNGDVFSGINCTTCDVNQKDEIKNKFIQLADNYGSEPNNRQQLILFQEMIRNSHSPYIKIDGRVLPGGLGDLVSELKINYNNDNTTYYINRGSIVIDNCVIKSFEFKSRKNS